QTTESPDPLRQNRASGETRTHTCRITGAVRCLSRSTGLNPRQESNLVLDLRTVVCEPAHTEDHFSWRGGRPALRNTPAGSRTQTSSFGGSRDRPFHHRGRKPPSSGRRTRTSI